MLLLWLSMFVIVALFGSFFFELVPGSNTLQSASRVVDTVPFWKLKILIILIYHGFNCHHSYPITSVIIERFLHLYLKSVTDG